MQIEPALGRTMRVGFATPGPSVWSAVSGQFPSMGGFPCDRHQEQCVIYSALEVPGRFSLGGRVYIRHVSRVMP
jgi:hypothetical protein